jgi:NitT/TauT family transport system permease protein
MLTGMRLAMGTCFSTIVAAELVAPEAGLGYLIFSARTWMQTEVAFVGIVLLGLLGFAVDRLFQLATTRLLVRYRLR